jgi:hypothetical protein
MSGTGIGGHQSTTAETDVWLTPPEITTALGPFDLDPCAAVGQPWDTAAKHYTIEDDGLTQPWHGYVWMNPPYGKSTAAWLQRLAAHGNGTALVFARTETAMFFEHVWPKADAILFIEGRLHFHHIDGTRAKGNSGGPSALVAYGDWAAYRLEGSGIPGQWIRLRGEA